MQARANATFCHWPSDSSTPLSNRPPSCVSMPSARLSNSGVVVGGVEVAQSHSASHTHLYSVYFNTTHQGDDGCTRAANPAAAATFRALTWGGAPLTCTTA
jgi:hypothetical protein